MLFLGDADLFANRMAVTEQRHSNRVFDVAFVYSQWPIWLRSNVAVAFFRSNENVAVILNLAILSFLTCASACKCFLFNIR